EPGSGPGLQAASGPTHWQGVVARWSFSCNRQLLAFRQSQPVNAYFLDGEVESGLTGISNSQQALKRTWNFKRRGEYLAVHWPRVMVLSFRHPTGFVSI